MGRGDTDTVAANRTNPVLECSGVAVDFVTADGPRRVLEGVDQQIKAGEFVTIIGQSGTGKTTLLRVLAGLVPAAAGTVRYEGASIAGPPPDTAFVFQNYSAVLLPWRTVSRNVALALEGRVPKAEREERVKEALDLVGLGHRGGEYPWRLSGGMQQRVQIARALAMRPRALFMDEPFGALDAMTRGQLQDELQRLHLLTGATIVFVTHDPDEAAYLSDRVIVVAGAPGRVEAEIEVDLDRPRDQIQTREQPRYLELRRRIHGAVHEVDRSQT
jgi:NitT/TauT family transport system ATP-binding protein